MGKGRVPYFKPEYNQPEPSLKPFLVDNGKKNGCVIVCPGGAYFTKSFHEGDPVCEKINSFGVSAFITRLQSVAVSVPAYNRRRASGSKICEISCR